ncbi:MAG TPA: 23S rRNA (pseudouridine(1915)-N(3))-methyltransferase RlmH [Exilispira sp.]|nr:23S rRNA (pseudouridine(1915)-N(3))-methyltransferase RlmH [Exilispira sp.]
MAKTIYFLVVGKLSNKNIKAIIDDYIKRTSSFFNIIQNEIKELGFTGKLEIEKEGEKINKNIEEDSFIIVCDEYGQKIDSQRFFTILDEIFVSYKSLTIIIGGSYGLSDDIKKKANLLLSLSNMTLTHQTARLLLTEQIYRYCMYKQNHPFVK